MSINRAYARLKPFDFDTVKQEFSNEHALAPLEATDGLVFPFLPSISETHSVNYDSSGLVHTNEQYNTYRDTSNVEISLSNCIFTCDTIENARYALAAIMFFRSYTKMDYGVTRSDRGQSYAPATGRPPCPMWFSALGKYGYSDLPVILNGCSIPMADSEVDLVPVPNPGAVDYNAAIDSAVSQSNNLSTQKEYIRRAFSNLDFNEDTVTYLPMKFTIDSISLTVQHTPQYWKSFSLSEYRSGDMIRRGEA